MGGFRFNGCGAKDYFKKMKYLGEQMCPNCGRMTPFYLEQVKFKVSVVYIPTVTLKNRYAIMCDKCKNGRTIEEAEMHRIMLAQNVDNLEIDVNQGKIRESNKICPKCGAKVTGMFCGVCGTKYEENNSAAVTTEKKICPNCGAELLEGMIFCHNCGYKTADPAKGKILDNVNTGEIAASDVKETYIQVEDVFAITGRGTVVTGKVQGGSLRVGQRLTWVHNQIQKSAEVEGIELNRDLLDKAEAGSDCGILLKNVSKRDVHKGDILMCLPGSENGEASEKF